MKITLFMAMSLNGMIASKNGDEEFLSHANWESFNDMATRCGCFIIGRKTYEKVQKWPDYNFNDIDARLKIVVSGNKDLKLNLPFLLASSPKDAVIKAVDLGFGDVIIVGGGSVNSAFMIENLIDEVVINIEPALIGSGVPLFAESDFEKRLSFIEMKKLTNDILQLRYRVNK